MHFGMCLQIFWEKNLKKPMLMMGNKNITKWIFQSKIGWRYFFQVNLFMFLPSRILRSGEFSTLLVMQKSHHWKRIISHLSFDSFSTNGILIYNMDYIEKQVIIFHTKWFEMFTVYRTFISMQILQYF
jgi:hypothetical protein